MASEVEIEINPSKAAFLMAENGIKEV